MKITPCALSLLLLSGMVWSRPANKVAGEPNDFANLDRAAIDARLARAKFRCVNLAELVACGDALNMKPNDPDLLVAEADALVQLKRPGEAIGVYRNVLTMAADREMVKEKIRTAEVQRRTLLDVCETNVGEDARRACEAAWLPGAPDQVALFKRRGLLLQSDHQLSSALDAYMAAARLKPADRGVALAIVSLSDSTERRDASTLLARGVAFMTLSRPSEAVAPLRQALQLAPDLAAAKTELRRAERAIVARSAARVAAEQASPAKLPPLDDPNRGDQAARYSNDAPVTRTD
jgi:tetratricopeptide (TPR) repeat protein